MRQETGGCRQHRIKYDRTGHRPDCFQYPRTERERSGGCAAQPAQRNILLSRACRWKRRAYAGRLR